MAMRLATMGTPIPDMLEVVGEFMALTVIYINIIVTYLFI